MKTVLFQKHVDANAKMVDFSGWEMPIHYGSQIEEHHSVRKDAGMFDVSHMLAVDLHGADVKAFLQYLLANDVAKIKQGKAIYSCMLNEKGGIVDDLIVYHLADDFFRVVVNAGNRASDVAWMKAHIKQCDVKLTVRDDLAILAIQGPNARKKVNALLPAECVSALQDIKPFSVVETHNWMVARTGYTGEDGYEIIFPVEKAEAFWDALLEAGVRPCGLGARDTLRLEAGMNLYGSDMDLGCSPLDAGLAWTVAMKDDRQFVGRKALESQKQQGIRQKLMGVVLDERGVIRAGQKVVDQDGVEGVVTSGTFSPTIQKSIALVSVNKEAKSLEVVIRNRQLPLRVVKYPFVRNGEVLV